MKKSVKIALMLVFMCVVSAGYADTDSATAPAPTTDATLVQNIVAGLVKPFMATTDAPGIAVAVYYKGHDYFFNYGVADTNTQTPITQDTIFELASIGKVFTTSILAVAVQNNEIRLTDPIIRYLPALKTTSGLPIDKVTVLNLATHSASFPRNTTAFGVQRSDFDGLMQALKIWQPSNPIGTQYFYSNIGFGLLGIVVQNAVNQSYMSQVNNEILGPLGMYNTFAVVPAEKLSQYAQGYNNEGSPVPHYQNTVFLGGGALRSSTNDLLKFVKANMGLAQGSASMQFLKALQIAHQPYYTVRPDFIMGLGWQRLLVNNQLFLTKNGNNQGFSSFIGFSPQQKIGVVLLVNESKIKTHQMGRQILFNLAQAN